MAALEPGTTLAHYKVLDKLGQGGQATAYKVGELRILALRERAKAALGARFDIRRFHNAVLDHGALPLTVLERVIDDWIETERTPPVS